ncbi:hypothetical protein [Pseudomonas syringae group genomosp. 3]|uniref:hypothetical protein n=1 Tax=Pseudomonas syringae group genomosp. 3 TaxID=251701 RepID=UPI000EFE7B5B|nr:hypothetical protein [Pseudomonas syringae group genomosp. 3]
MKKKTLNFKHFNAAIKKFHTSESSSLELYFSLLLEMDNRKLLDENFISQMSDHDKTIQRLSELLILKYCINSTHNKIYSKKDGPDIAFKFGDRTVNIELVIPLIVSQEKISLRQYCYSLNGGPTAPISIEASKPKTESLYERITSTLTSKCRVYDEYLHKKKISTSDVNIICINIGFIQENDLIDFENIRYLFEKQVGIHINIDEEKNLSPSALDLDFYVKKDTGVEFTTSYFDNMKHPQIDGVWIISCNENSLNTIKNTYDPYRNMMYKNVNSKIDNTMLTSLRINTPQPDSFAEHIRKQGSLPG